MLAKGLAGLGLPVIVFALFLAFGGGWAHGAAGAPRVRAGGRRRSPSPIVAVPWHHAMLIRHGAPFWSELFGDNHWRRMVIGRHGDRGEFDYFLRELGYGLWPWVALAPAAFAWSVLRRPLSTDSDVEARKQGALRLGAIWFASAYARGLAVDDEVPPLRPAGDPRAGGRHRRVRRRPAGAAGRTRRPR